MLPLKTIFNKNLKYAFFLKNVLSYKCPLIINKWYTVTNGNKMVEKCSVYSQRTELEPVFCQGTGYVSYGLSVWKSIITFVLWISATGNGFKNREVLWLTMFFHGNDKSHTNNTKNNYLWT